MENAQSNKSVEVSDFLSLNHNKNIDKVEVHSIGSNVLYQKKQKHICSYCGKIFTQNNHLQQHVRIHTGERPYVCHLCNTAFHQQGSLSVHYRIHTGERPFKCHLCEYCGVTSSNLKSHLKRKHMC